MSGLFALEIVDYDSSRVGDGKPIHENMIVCQSRLSIWPMEQPHQSAHEQQSLVSTSTPKYTSFP